MNKPLLMVLLVILVALGALAVYRLAFKAPEEPLPPVELEKDKDVPFLQEVDGIETDETPEFDVEVATKEVGARKVLEFTITETHGWAVKQVYVQAYFGKVNPDTGEFETEMKDPPQVLCKDIIRFGKPLVLETTLTTPELDQTGGELGGPENWNAAVYKWGTVYKPKQ